MNDVTGTTDPKGEFSFNGIEPASYTINASKDGFESGSQDVDVSQGKDQSVTISLVKSSTASTSEKLKDLKDLKSYMFVLKVTQVDGTVQSTMTAEIADGGKEEQLISTDENGKTDNEIYVVGDKAVMGTPGSYTEFDTATAKQYIEAITAIGQNYMEGFKTSYNDYIVSPSLYATWKTSNDSQNGYSTTKVEYTIHTDAGEGIYTGWVINKGDYKDYTTKLVIQLNYTDAKPSDLKTFEINITNIGGSFDIKIPNH
jgi:hypothetical protein